jgi:hypothetical protein
MEKMRSGIVYIVKLFRQFVKQRKVAYFLYCTENAVIRKPSVAGAAR